MCRIIGQLYFSSYFVVPSVSTMLQCSQPCTPVRLLNKVGTITRSPPDSIVVIKINDLNLRKVYVIKGDAVES